MYVLSLHPEISWDYWGQMFLDTSRKQAHYLDTYNYGENYTHRTIDLYVKLVA